MRDAEKILGILMELTRSFTREMPLELLLKQITDTALELMPGTHVSLRVLNDQKTELICEARSGEGIGSPPMVFKRGEGVVGWVVDYGRPVNIPDTEADRRFKPGRNQGFSIRSLCAVPLRVGDRVIGVLASSAPETETFSIDDLALLQLLANCTVPVIEKARLDHVSPYDDLTLALKGTETLPALEDAMLRARQLDTPLSLMVVALDDLEHIYRDHDFETGNMVLRRFADRVRELSHSTHRLLRQSVETFALILPDTAGAMAMQHGEMLRVNLCDYPLHVTSELSVEQHISAAVSTWNGTEPPASMLRRTEAAAAAVQEQGGNSVVWSGKPPAE